MKSRIVRPVNRRGQTNRKKRSTVSGDTQPMRPVGQSYGRNRLSDTQPMPAAEIRAKYNAYRQTIDRRREVLRTPQPQPARRKPRTSAKTKYEKYFDYDLLLVIVFLMPQRD